MNLLISNSELSIEFQNYENGFEAPFMGKYNLFWNGPQKRYIALYPLNKKDKIEIQGNSLKNFRSDIEYFQKNYCKIIDTYLPVFGVATEC